MCCRVDVFGCAHCRKEDENFNSGCCMYFVEILLKEISDLFFRRF